MTLFGIDSAMPISPANADAAKADVVAVYVGGVNNGGWRWQPQHAQALRNAGKKVFPIYVGQNVGYFANRLSAIGGRAEAQDAILCAERFGFKAGDLLCPDIEYGNWEQERAATEEYANAFVEETTRNGWRPFPYHDLRMAQEWNPPTKIARWVCYWPFSDYPGMVAFSTLPTINQNTFGLAWQYYDKYMGQYDANIFDDTLFPDSAAVAPKTWKDGQSMGTEALPGIVSRDGKSRYFNETGHYLSGGFRGFWEKYGNIVLFGFPISEEFTMGNGVVVQYFERCRMEWNPANVGANPDLFDVQLGRLGAELVAANNQANVNADSFLRKSFNG